MSIITFLSALAAVKEIVGYIAACSIAVRVVNTRSADAILAYLPDITLLSALAAVRGIIGRIDFYTIAIHDAITWLAFSFAANQPIIALVVTCSAMIDVSERVSRDIRTIGRSSPGHTSIVFTD